MKAPKLNLPEFDLKTRKTDRGDEIWDIVRRKWILYTPEEWIRQNFLHFLIYNLKYPKSQIIVESGLSYNRLSKRSDIKVFKGEKVFMIVECKAPNIKLNEKALQQILSVGFVPAASPDEAEQGFAVKIMKLHPSRFTAR